MSLSNFTHVENQQIRLIKLTCTGLFIYLLRPYNNIFVMYTPQFTMVECQGPNFSSLARFIVLKPRLRVVQEHSRTVCKVYLKSPRRNSIEISFLSLIPFFFHLVDSPGRECHQTTQSSGEDFPFRVSFKSFRRSSTSRNYTGVAYIQFHFVESSTRFSYFVLT